MDTHQANMEIGLKKLGLCKKSKKTKEKKNPKHSIKELIKINGEYKLIEKKINPELNKITVKESSQINQKLSSIRLLTINTSNHQGSMLEEVSNLST